MRLTFLGKDSKPDESPTLYATDQDSYIVQGWIVTDVGVLSQLDLPEDETVVEVPARLLVHLAKDGLDGTVANLVPPVVFVKANGNYIIRGSRVTDAEALAQMDIPDHETCVNVARRAMAALLGEGERWS